MFFKKAVLLIHGFAGNTGDYGNLSNYLQLYSHYDVFTFTLPGHDKVFITKVTYDEWIDEAEKQMDILINHGYHHICVVGHSMGGVIASYIANKYRKYVKKLILAAPAFKYMYFKNNKMDILKSLEKSPEIFEGLDTHMVLSRLFKVPLHTAKEFAKLVDKYKKEPQSISCPILIIHGLDDKMVPLDSCEYVYNSVKSNVALLISMADVNHDCFTGKRNDDVCKVVKNFLNNNYWGNIKEKKEL